VNVTGSRNRIRLAIDLTIVIVGGLLALLVHTKYTADMESTRQEYIMASQVQMQEDALRIQEAITQIYQGIRTIGQLPSIKGIDRHGKLLKPDDSESVIQLYKNLRTNVTISEIYIVPADLEPEQIDPVTGNLQEPIIMFDDEIASHSELDESAHQNVRDIAQAEAAEEVEIHEYRILKDQMVYLNGAFLDEKKIDGLKVPMIGSSSVVTCDNEEYATTHHDSDRSGAIFSVPFYSKEGKLKGTVSAIVRDNVLRSYLPNDNGALLNDEYGYILSSTNPGQVDDSREWVEQEKPDPSLIFSAACSIAVPDPRSQWIFWTGNPNELFFSGTEVHAVSVFRSLMLIIIGLFVISGIVVNHWVQSSITSTAQTPRRAVSPNCR
jgi:hypothetical protein